MTTARVPDPEAEDRDDVAEGLRELPLPEPESRFQRVADAVSFGMGTPTNVVVWIVFVVFWFSIFALHLVGPDSHFLPSWFTGTSFNFPLNTVTTLAELYIGFLVAAGTNRAERELRRILAYIVHMVRRLEAVESAVLVEVRSNTALTQEVKTDTALLQEIHEHVSALAPEAGHLEPGETPRVAETAPPTPEVAEQASGAVAELLETDDLRLALGQARRIVRTGSPTSKLTLAKALVSLADAAGAAPA